MSDAVRESYFWGQVKAGLEDPDTQLNRVENSAGTGISDVNGCRNGVEIWMELKVFHGNRLHFRNSQRSWIVRRHQVGGRVFVVARKDNLASAEFFIYRAVEVVLSYTKPDSKKKGFSVLESDLPKPLYHCSKPFKWDEARAILFER